MRRRVARCLGLVLAAGCLNSAPALAGANPFTSLPIHDEIFDMVVDGAHNLVFVSPGTGESKLAVLDYTGSIVTTLSIAGASGMALVGSTLYMAAADADEIAVVDAAASPPEVIGALSIGSFTHPEAIAYVGGQLWFTTGVCGGTVSHAHVNLDGSGLSAAQDLAADVCPRYVPSPADPDLLLMFDEGAEMQLYLYDVSTTPATSVQSASHPAGGSGGYDAAFVPNGSSFITASERPTSFTQIATSDLSKVRSYEADAFPVAVDVTASGGGRVAGGTRSFQSDDVWIYKLGHKPRLWRLEFPWERVVRRGIAWADDGSRVFTVSVASPDGLPVHFRALDPLETATEMDLQARPRTPTVGSQVRISGQLIFGDASSPKGQTVHVTRKDAGSKESVGDAIVAADGSFVLVDKPTTVGRTMYIATFSGSEHHASVSRRRYIWVRKIEPNVEVSVTPDPVTSGESVTITGHLGPGTDSRVLELWARPNGGSWKLLRRARVDSYGNLTTRYEVTRNTTFTARYEGDTTHKAASDEVMARVRALVVVKCFGSTSTSGGYQVYQVGKAAPCAAHVAPNHEGFSVQVVLQRYKSGAWKIVDSERFGLTATSDAGFYVYGALPANFRLRATLPNHAHHIESSSPWLYLRFT